MKKENEKRKRDPNRKYYITGEIFGKIGIIATAVVIVSMTIGTGCMLIWDFKERKARRNKTNKH